MGYYGQGIGNIIQGILSPIVATSWVTNEGIGFDGREYNSKKTKTTFLMEIYMSELAFSSRERE
jgi:hypothetical protein